jgi:hypothetical protein
MPLLPPQKWCSKRSSCGVLVPGWSNFLCENPALEINPELECSWTDTIFIKFNEPTYVFRKYLEHKLNPTQPSAGLPPQSRETTPLKIFLIYTVKGVMHSV